MRIAQRPFWAAVAVCTAATLAPHVASAQAPRSGTAADIVPADVTFFSTSVGLDRVYDAVANSNAFRQVMALPQVQQGLAELKRQPQWQQFEGFANSEQGQMILDVAKDAVSHEVFLYGGEGITDLLGSMQQFQQTNMMQSIMAATTGQQPNPLPALIDLTLAQEDFEFPATVIGLKSMKKDEAAQLQAMVYGAAQQFADQAPVELGTEQNEHGTLYTVSTKGSMWPIPEEDFVENLMDDADVTEAKARKFYQWVQGLELDVTFGMHDDYIVFSIASDHDHLANLGGAGSLAASDVMDPVRKWFGNEDVVSIGYVSEEMAELQAFDPEATREQGSAALENFSFLLGPDRVDRLRQDLAELVDDVAARTSEPSESVGVNLLNDGVESYTFSKSKPYGLEFNERLTVLKHAAKAPLLAVAVNSASSAQDYATTIKWVKKAYGYAYDFVLPNLGDENVEMADQYIDVLKPFFEKVESITRNDLIPATDAGMVLFQIDLDLRIKDLADGETLRKPMPVPNPLVVSTLNDSEKFVQAIEGYFDAVEELAPKLAELTGEEQFKQLADVPRPLSEAAPGGGMRYFYEIPTEAGVDRNVLPNAVVTPKALVLGLSPLTTTAALEENLVAPTPVVDITLPSAVVAKMDFGGLQNAIREWIEYLNDEPDGPFENMDADEKEMFRTTFDAAMNVFGTLKGVTARTYRDGDYTVNHAWLHVEDSK